MKRYRTIVLMAIIFIISTTLTVYASSKEITMKTSTTEVKVGDIVTVIISAQNDTGVEGFDSTLEYDKTKLELTNENQLATKEYANFSGANDKTGEFKLSLAYGELGKAPQQADVAKLEFKVLDGAKENENLSIKLSKIELVDPNLKGTTLENQTVTLKVKENNNSVDKKDNIISGGNINNVETEDYELAVITGTKKYALAIIAGVIAVVVLVYLKSNKKRNKK